MTSPVVTESLLSLSSTAYKSNRYSKLVVIFIQKTPFTVDFATKFDENKLRFTILVFLLQYATICNKVLFVQYLCKKSLRATLHKRKNVACIIVQ